MIGRLALLRFRTRRLFPADPALSHRIPRDDEDWGFALYDPATETYTPAMLRTGHPSDALDTAAIIHPAEHEQ